MTTVYYVEFYDKKDDLLDCTAQYASKQAAINDAKDSGFEEFEYALVIQKDVVNKLNWNLVVNKS